MSMVCLPYWCLSLSSVAENSIWAPGSAGPCVLGRPTILLFLGLRGFCAKRRKVPGKPGELFSLAEHQLWIRSAGLPAPRVLAGVRGTVLMEHVDGRGPGLVTEGQMDELMPTTFCDGVMI